MREELIRNLIEAKVITSKLHLNQKWKDRLTPELEIEVNKSTSYLVDVDLPERFLNIRLGIINLPRCERCESSLAGKVWKSKLD